MKFLKILLYCLWSLLFAFIFILLWVILVYVWENDRSEQTYQIPTITLNVWTGDKNINQLPTLDTLALSFPQLQWDGMNRAIFGCPSTSNLTIKVTAINPNDPDWNITRLKFYYYNVDDPDRILEYKESWIFSPYAYFAIPRIERWEYGFWVILYDNNWGIINSDDIIWKWPVVYLPSLCSMGDVPMVTLKVDSTSVKVWDTVTFSVISKISSDNINFEKDRTFYYDFTWDGIRDLVTNKDTIEFTFEEAYENWIIPRAAVEYKWKLWKTEWATVYVENWFKPILLYNSIGNTVIFRDLSMWIIQQRQICFEDKECNAWNSKYRKTHMETDNPYLLTWWSETSITKNDTFLFKYDEEWPHNVSIYLKNKYWDEIETWFIIETKDNKENWLIAPWINMITIPETTFTNWNPEIFLSKPMKDILIMYINNDSWETCYLDTDISKDSNWDWKQDNDRDLECNRVAKIIYEPNYNRAIWRVYFTNNWKLTFKNFYVTFQWYISELDEEKMEIYNDITVLIDGIEDVSMENVELKQFLNWLRNSLNDRIEITNLLISIKERIANWWILIDVKQKELLDYIISRFENELIVFDGMNEYEKYKEEILALLPTGKWSGIKSTIEEMFMEYEYNQFSYNNEERAKELWKIWDKIIKDWKKNKWLDDERDFDVYFCGMYDYFDIAIYENRCETYN